MTPTELVAKIKMLADTPPTIAPFVKAAQLAVMGAQSDLVRLNQASNVSIAVESGTNSVTVRWRSLPGGSGRSQITPSAAIKAHLDYQIKQAKIQVQADLNSQLHG